MSRRLDLALLVRFVTAPVRALTWLLGAVLGSIVAGFVAGWKDAA